MSPSSSNIKPIGNNNGKIINVADLNLSEKTGQASLDKRNPVKKATQQMIIDAALESQKRRKVKDSKNK